MACPEINFSALEREEEEKEEEGRGEGIYRQVGGSYVPSLHDNGTLVSESLNPISSLTLALFFLSIVLSIAQMYFGLYFFILPIWQAASSLIGQSKMTYTLVHF